MIPYTLNLKFGFTCNNNCMHCDVSHSRKFADLSLKQIIGQLDFCIKKYKTINLILTGGELTIRDDALAIFDAVAQRKKQGKIKNVYLQTNGTGLSNQLLAKKCCEVADNIVLAIHAPYAELHDAITQVAGSFYATIAGLHNILDCIRDGSHVQLTTQTVISRLNYPVLPGLFCFLQDVLKVNKAMLSFPRPNTNACSINIYPLYEEVSLYVNMVLRSALTKGFAVFVEQIPLCVIDENIRSFYKVHTLIDSATAGHDIGQAMYDGYSIDYKQRNQHELGKFKTCCQCIYNDQCSGVWKEYLAFYPKRLLFPILDGEVN